MPKKFLKTPALVALLTLLAAALRFYRIGHQGFWYDESYTALLLHHSAGRLLGLIPHTESTPPLYYMTAWIWVHLFGSAEAGLRSLSALAGVLVVPVAYLAAAKLLSPRAGLISAALTACNPFLIWYSQEARAYESLVLLCAVSLLAFAYAQADPRPRWLAAWAIASALAMCTHYYAVVCVVPEAVLLLAAHRRRRGPWLAVAAVGVCGLALVPLIVAQSGSGNDQWISTAPLIPRLAQILPQFLIGTGMPHRQLFKYVAFALAAVAVALAARERDRRTLIAVAIAGGGFLLSLAFIVAGSDTLITRNIIGLWLPAAIGLAAGLASSRAKALGTAVTLGLCAIGVTATVAVATTEDLQRPDWRPVAKALGGPPPAGTSRLILTQHYAYVLPLRAYLPRLAIDWVPGGRRVHELDVIGMSSPQQPLCWWGAACNLHPSHVQQSFDFAGFHEVSRRRIEQFTVVRLVADQPRTLTEAEIRRGITATRLAAHDSVAIQRSATG